MSILLDSLRKSEAQRNAGGTPTIYSTQEYGDSGNSHRNWVLWLLLALTAAVIVWFGWRQYSLPDQAESATAVPTENTPVADASNTALEITLPETGSATASRTPVEQITRVPDSASEGSSVNASEDIGTAAEKVARFVAEEQARIEESQEQTEGQTGGQSDEQSVSGIPETGNGPEFLAEDSLVDEEPVIEDLPGQDRLADRPLRSRLSEIDPPKDEPLSYWQLEQGLRNELPEFKITVLVFAEAPEDRFLLMNGERLREQDELESGITLEEIRRDGAIFSYRSRRFLVRN